MLFFQDSKIDNIVINRVGNKLRDEFYTLYDDVVDVKSMDERVYAQLIGHLARQFSTNPIVYRLFHENGLDLNETYNVIDNHFNNDSSIKETADLLTKHLYESSTHPKLSSGRVYVIKFKGLQFEGEECDAIGIYKQDDVSYDIQVQEKENGCSLSASIGGKLIGFNESALILNRDKDEGFSVVISDTLKGVYEQYWLWEFLQVKPRNDAYLKTSIFMKLAKSFIGDKLEDQYEMEPADKADLLIRSVNYFKEKEIVDINEFTQEILGDESIISMFNEYKESFEDEWGLTLGNNFEKSNKAFKKQQSSFKQIIKLDNNFQLYLHGNRKLLERSYDEEKGMNYYKLYFENEK